MASVDQPGDEKAGTRQGEPIHLRILCSGQNWVRIGGQIALGLCDYQSMLPRGSTVAAVLADPAATAVEGPRWVASGQYDVAFTTPVYYAQMAGEGTGFFQGEEPLPLRALAHVQHDDRMVFAVRQATGIRSFRHLVDEKYPLKLACPPLASRHPAATATEAVLNCYGASLADIETWGGTLLPRMRERPGVPSNPSRPPVDESFDAVFDEAVMTPRFKRLFDAYDMRALPLDADVLAELGREGHWPGVLRGGYFRGQSEDVPTIDCSGWLIFCRADLADDVAYSVAAALQARRPWIESMFSTPNSSMTSPLDPALLSHRTGLPLHRGAARFYREQGCDV